MKDVYYRVGEQAFHWFWKRDEDVPKGHESQRSQEAQLKRARALAKETGLPLELRERERLNDYVGSPIWGKDRLLQELPLVEGRTRPSALAA